MHRFGEEVGKGEGVACVAAHGGHVVRGGGGEDGGGAVEAEVGPRGHEGEEGEEHCRFGAEEGAGDGVEEEEEGGEVLDSHAEDAPDGHGVLGDQLLEGDEKAGLDGDAPGNGGVSVMLSARCSVYSIVKRGDIPRLAAAGQDVEPQVQQPSEDIGYHPYDEQEFGILVATPRPFQIAPSEEECRARDRQAEHVLLDEGGGCKCPGELV